MDRAGAPIQVVAGEDWIGVCGAPAPGGAPRRVSAAGRDLVVWRTEKGRLSVLHDSCPHQGNPLSSGSVQGEFLRCVSHGYLVDADGWCDRAGISTGSVRARESGGVVYVKLMDKGPPA
jgi:phenylpropionate dioxygenase-like ring-hydroxylating dioxygenase large terminal subunit